MIINRSLITLLVFVALWVLALGGRSEAASIPFSYTAAGSFTGDIYIFPDATEGGSITLQGRSSSGPVTVQEWASFSGPAPLPNSCTPPGGPANEGTLFSYADSLEVITFLATGDVLVQNLVSGTACADFSLLPSPVPFDGTLIVSNVGGTGKFAGATGPVLRL